MWLGYEYSRFTGGTVRVRDTIPKHIFSTLLLRKFIILAYSITLNTLCTVLSLQYANTAVLNGT